MNRAQFLRLITGGLAGALLAGPMRAASAAVAEYDFWFTRLKYDSGDWDVDARMPANLITSLIDYTNLRVDPKEHVLSLSDPRMLTAPFCYLAGHKLCSKVGASPSATGRDKNAKPADSKTAASEGIFRRETTARIPAAWRMSNSSS
jgi:hypothetical protein